MSHRQTDILLVVAFSMTSRSPRLQARRSVASHQAAKTARAAAAASKQKEAEKAKPLWKRALWKR